MRIETLAIVLTNRPHGENGAVVKLLTPGNGLQAAYVRGARGRRLRPVLLAGNVVEARLASRAPNQLAQATIEMTQCRGPLLCEPLPSAAIEWACALTATALPESQPYPAIFQALDGLLAAIEAAPSASGWGAALVRFELLMLSELGFGLDLESCAVSGATHGLVAVSPKSGRAVGKEAAAPFGEKLLPLPEFLVRGGFAGWTDILDGLRLTGHFLSRDLIPDRASSIEDARERLIQRLRKAAGTA